MNLRVDSLQLRVDGLDASHLLSDDLHDLVVPRIVHVDGLPRCALRGRSGGMINGFGLGGWCEPLLRLDIGG